MMRHEFKGDAPAPYCERQRIAGRLTQKISGQETTSDGPEYRTPETRDQTRHKQMDKDFIMPKRRDAEQ